MLSLLLALACSSPPQEPRLTPLDIPAPEKIVFAAQLQFLEGCWRSSDGATEECWRTEGEVLKGENISRRADGSEWRETMTIHTAPPGTLIAEPEGQARTVFALSQLGEGFVRFDNPEHDYPQWVRYERRGDTLVASIGAAGQASRSWTWRRVVPFEATVTPLPEDLRAAMTGTSWREGCPVALDDLRLVTLPHHDFEGSVQQGRLVVVADVADVVVEAFRAAFDEGFPIASMRPVSEFGGDDEASMNANNTSAFNCRYIAGTTTWSEHSYGHAIDVNPVQNPYLRFAEAQPLAGEAYRDRTPAAGLLTADSALVRILKSHGWGWGGEWARYKDYQHLSRSGR